MAENGKAAVVALLQSVSCGKLVEGQKPITIPADATIDKACEILASNGILSALVESPTGDGFVGVFSYRSLLHYFLKQFPADGDAPSTATGFDLRTVIMNAKPDVLASEFCRQKNKDFQMVRPEQSLQDAVAIFATGIHRCSVVDHNQKILGTLSQSLALRFISRHIDRIESVVSRPISSFENLGNRPAIVIEDRRNVIEGMELMHKHKLSSVAVVDSTGKLNGNLSLSDIKYIFRTRSYQMLWYTVMSFVKLLRERLSLELNAGMDTFPFFDITKEKPLSLAIQKMVATRVHHLWLVDAGGKPTGVISITDIMRCLTE